MKITATPKGRQRNTGTWSRPDITVVEVDNYEFLPEATVEVTTFEVKRSLDAQNISSIYETAAHSRGANYAYLVAEIQNQDYEFPERFVGEAERFNIGVMVMWKKGKEWQFAEKREPNRFIPDPKELDSFLKSFFSQDAKAERQFKLSIRRG